MRFKDILLSTLFSFFTFSIAFATHNRAGEITYKQISNFKFEVTVVTYTKESSPADRDSLELFWGDGQSQFIPRIEEVILADDVKRNEYSATHTYPGPSSYTLSIVDANRIASIINVNDGGSVNIPFYVETELIVLDPQFFGFNNSPVLLQPPLDYANVNTIFKHNPNAFDSDGDSLSYQLIIPKQNANADVPNYLYPDEVGPGPNNNIMIDAITGELEWASPKVEGIYNIAILISEYRNGFLIGTLLRDMQIIVLDVANLPPDVKEINDTCVIAGELLNISVTATDPNIGQVITLSAEGGPLEVSPNPANFNTIMGTDSITGQFSWQTTCDHVRKFFYEVVFKAEDNFVQGGNLKPLADLETWLITVVAPPPENLTATALTGRIILNWDNPYECFSSTKFQGFTIWRKLGSGDTFSGKCPVNLADLGYTAIAIGIDEHTYEDKDVEIGFEYCYRVTAGFADGGGNFPYNKVESLPSNEVCEQLKQDIPVITHVTVTETDSINGKIQIAWLKPKREDLDTIQNPGPYEYKIYRKTNAAGTYTEIKSFTAPTYNTFNDTAFLDSTINTVDNQYYYLLEFYVNNGTLLGETEPASSVYLTIEPTDNRLILSWQEDVPWFNDQYVIFKKEVVGNNYFPLDTVTVSTYVDKGLKNDSIYCYYIQSIGTYGTDEVDTLINNSQIVCKAPVDNIPPCEPILEVINNCDIIPEIPWVAANFKNTLNWVDPSDSCAEDVLFYNIYYAPTFTADSQIIATQLPADDSIYVHANLFNSVAGCYMITAVDSNNNESRITQKKCVDNCPIYDLPNVFTPNGDGQNDLYTPYKVNGVFKFRFIDHVDFQVFNRWGQLLFETSDPEINWNGTDKNGKELVEGVYYYGCDVYETRLEGIIKREKPLKGYIHILRGDKN